jgi:hypothetical protein
MGKVVGVRVITFTIQVVHAFLNLIKSLNISYTFMQHLKSQYFYRI